MIKKTWKSTNSVFLIFTLNWGPFFHFESKFIIFFSNACQTRVLTHFFPTKTYSIFVSDIFSLIFRIFCFLNFFYPLSENCFSKNCLRNDVYTTKRFSSKNIFFFFCENVTTRNITPLGKCWKVVTFATFIIGTNFAIKLVNFFQSNLKILKVSCDLNVGCCCVSAKFETTF